MNIGDRLKPGRPRSIIPRSANTAGLRTSHANYAIVDPAMSHAARINKYRIMLVMLVFLVFLGNAIGVINLHFLFGSRVSVNGDILADLLQQGILSPVLTSPDFIIFAVTGALLAVAIPILTPIQASITVFITMLVPLYLNYSNPVMGRYIPLEYILLTILILFVINVLVSYFTETHERQKILTLFGQYIPSELVDILSEQPEALAMEGEAREMTVLFCDIKGFTGIAEQLEPPQLAAMLNCYFTAMTRVLYQHGATIDKYMGDAVMAFWGAPIKQADHPRRAVRAALRMIAEIRRLEPAFREHGWPPLSLGIGISTGTMAVGNMGSEYRMAYTVVGDTVNLGARLEQLTRVYGNDIIVSQATTEAVSDIAFQELDLVRVKGRDHVSRIYEPVALYDELDDHDRHRLELHARALKHYYCQEWPEARALLAELSISGDRPEYYQLFLDRIVHYIDSPPGKEWQGETDFHIPASLA